VCGLASGLAQNGNKVDLLSTVPGGTGVAQTEGTLTTRIFDREWPQSLSPSALLNAHLRANDYDVVHHHGLWLRTLDYARRAAVKSSTPLIISPRGMMSPWAWAHHRTRKSLAAHLIHPGAFSAASGWHATSEEESGDIRRLGFTQPVCVAPNGVTAPLAEDENKAAAFWREKYPLLTGRRVALFHSRFHAKKRVLELIDLWLSAPRDDWLLMLVGIPEEYSVRQLETYVLRQSGTGRVIIHDGTNSPPPYPIASLFLLPSHSENFGLVVAEALVRGLPALTTDTTPWQTLETTGSGRCVSWADYGPALASLLNEPPEALASRGNAGRAWARDEFSWEKTARVLAAFYENLRTAGR
jgi:glycosyltransferase involved in cell wall biosynthesis